MRIEMGLVAKHTVWYVLPMNVSYHRKKDPEGVRRALLDCAASLAVQKGLSQLSIQSVATAAGVTKGGLFHHFPNKQALLQAVGEDLLSRLDDLIDAFIKQTSQGYGCFTYAYIESVFTADATTNPWAVLSISILADSELRGLWLSWLLKRQRRHVATDADPELGIIRLAADGVWLANLMAGSHQHQVAQAAIRARLQALMTLNRSHIKENL